MMAAFLMPDPPAKPPELPAEPPEELVWDTLDEDSVSTPDPLDDPWPEGEDKGGAWDEEPLTEDGEPVSTWGVSDDDDPLDDQPEPDELRTNEVELGLWEDEGDAASDEEWLKEAVGPVVVGWSERASLPSWGIHRLPARCSTDQETSSLHVDLRTGLPGRATLVLGDKTVDAGVGELGDELVALTLVRLVGREFQATLRLVGTSGPPHLVLGRDVLAGRFLVDPSLTWTQRPPS